MELQDSKLDTAESLPQSALRTSWHFACVRGPHRGLIIVPGITHEAFPYTCQGVMDSHGREKVRLHLTDHSIRMCIKSGRLAPWKKYTASGLYHAGPSLAIKVVSSSSIDYYEYRPRPQSLHFPDPNNAERRFLPIASFTILLPLMLFTGLRIFTVGGTGKAGLLFFVLPLLLIVGTVITAIRNRRKGERIDPAALALVLQACPAQQRSLFALFCKDVGASQQWRLSVPRSQDQASTGSVLRDAHQAQTLSQLIPHASQDVLHYEYVGVVGEHAKLTALWIAAQIAAQAGGARIALSASESFFLGQAHPDALRITVHGLGDDWTPHAHEQSSPENEGIHLAWATDFCELPTWCQVAIPASEPQVSASWWKMLSTSQSSTCIPDSCSFDSLSRTGIDTDFALKTPIGHDPLGEISIDLVDQGPHALIAGTTGSGKSEALRTWLLGLCSRYSPARLRLVLVDYKGGASFAPFALLPHTEAVLTDLDVGESTRALRGLATCIAQREADLAALKIKDLHQWNEAYQQGSAPPPPPRILIVIDEFRVLADLHPTTLDTFSRLASQGRSLGLHLIYAPQHPSGSVNAHMRANTELRIALRTISEAESHDIVGSGVAAHLPRLPGRASIGSSHEFQFAYCLQVERTVKEISDQLRTKDISSHSGPQDPLWCPPLPSRIPRLEFKQLESNSSDSGIVLGLCDGIDRGSHFPLLWEHGNIALCGPGSSRLKLASIARSCAFALSDALGLPVYGMRPLTARHSKNPKREDFPFLMKDILDFGVFCEALEEYAPCIVWVEEIETVIHEMEERFGVLRGHEIWNQFTRMCDGVTVTLIATETSGRFSLRSIYGSFEHCWFDIPNSDVASQCRFLRQVEFSKLEGQLWNPAQETLLALCTDYPNPVLSLSLFSWSEVLRESKEGLNAMLAHHSEEQMPIAMVLPTIHRTRLGRSERRSSITRLPKTPIHSRHELADRAEISVETRFSLCGIYYGAQLKRFLFSTQKCILIGEENSILEEIVRTINPSCTINYFEQSQWLKALRSADELTIFPSPPQEALRVISQSFQGFPASLHSHVWNPFSGVIIHHGLVRRFVLLF